MKWNILKIIWKIQVRVFFHIGIIWGVGFHTMYWIMMNRDKTERDKTERMDKTEISHVLIFKDILYQYMIISAESNLKLTYVYILH